MHITDLPLALFYRSPMVHSTSFREVKSHDHPLAALSTRRRPDVRQHHSVAPSIGHQHKGSIQVCRSIRRITSLMICIFHCRHRDHLSDTNCKLSTTGRRIRRCLILMLGSTAVRLNQEHIHVCHRCTRNSPVRRGIEKSHHRRLHSTTILRRLTTTMSTISSMMSSYRLSMKDLIAINGMLRCRKIASILMT